ncbi:unnamed protein product, partial [Ceratitis capitata]
MFFFLLKIVVVSSTTRHSHHRIHGSFIYAFFPTDEATHLLGRSSTSSNAHAVHLCSFTRAEASLWRLWPTLTICHLTSMPRWLPGRLFGWLVGWPP